MVSRRRYVDNSPVPTFGPVGTGDTSFTVSSATGLPVAFPFTATLDMNTASQENVLITNIVGTTVTVTRNYDSLGAFSHAAGATLTHTAIALDFDEANAHHVATTGVHGVAGAVVGTTDSQTLSNKTFAGLALTANSGVVGVTVTGDNSAHLADFKKSSTTVASIDKDGNLAAQAISGTTVAASSNATVGGTFAVTGATTLAGVTATTVAASSNATVAGTFGVTGASSIHGLTVTGNETVSGTLAVAGATTLAAVGATNVTASGTLSVAGTTTVVAVTGSGTATFPNTVTRPTVPNYANSTARDAAIPSPVVGDIIAFGGVEQIYNGTQWASILAATITNNGSITGTFANQPLKIFSWGNSFSTDANADTVVLASSNFTGVLFAVSGGGSTFNITTAHRIVSGNLTARVWNGNTLAASTSVSLTGFAICW